MAKLTLIYPYAPSFLWMIKKKMRLRKVISDLLSSLDSIGVNLNHPIPKLNPTEVWIIYMSLWTILGYPWTQTGLENQCHSKVYTQAGAIHSWSIWSEFTPGGSGWKCWRPWGLLCVKSLVLLSFLVFCPQQPSTSTSPILNSAQSSWRFRHSLSQIFNNNNNNNKPENPSGLL